jgi:hypothetical protein
VISAARLVRGNSTPTAAKAKAAVNAAVSPTAVIPPPAVRLDARNGATAMSTAMTAQRPSQASRA